MASLTEFLMEQGSVSRGDGERVAEWARQSNDLLGSIAMDHGLLSCDQIREVLRQQRQQGELFGDACVKLGYLGERELAVLLRAQEMRRNRCEMERLMLLGAIEVEQSDQLLSGFHARAGAAVNCGTRAA